jgi:hypothetical protein
MNLTDEQKAERRRLQWAERYQRIKKEKEATTGGGKSDAERSTRHPSAGSSRGTNNGQPLNLSRERSVHRLAMRERPDESGVRWVSSLTPENWTVAADHINVREHSLNPSLVIAPESERALLAPSLGAGSVLSNGIGRVASVRSWSPEIPGAAGSGNVLESIETEAYSQRLMHVGGVSSPVASLEPHVRSRGEELDPLLSWLSDFSLYDMLNLSVLQAPDRDWVYSQRSPPVFKKNKNMMVNQSEYQKHHDPHQRSSQAHSQITSICTLSPVRYLRRNVGREPCHATIDTDLYSM